jgi:hypothetical protein
MQCMLVDHTQAQMGMGAPQQMFDAKKAFGEETTILRYKSTSDKPLVDTYGCCALLTQAPRECVVVVSVVVGSALV